MPDAENYDDHPEVTKEEFDAEQEREAQYRAAMEEAACHWAAHNSKG